jgi:hypothetical protein
MPTGCKQCTIDLLGIFWQHFIELVWQSKDKVIVWHGQEFAFPVTDPPFTVGSLALGAVAVPAGIITNRKDATGLANSNMAAQGFGPAKGQSPEGFSYLYDRLVLLSERCTVNADDIANFIPGLQGLYSLSNGSVHTGGEQPGHVQVNHGSIDVCMAQLVLDRNDIYPLFQ